MITQAYAGAPKKSIRGQDTAKFGDGDNSQRIGIGLVAPCVV